MSCLNRPNSWTESKESWVSEMKLERKRPETVEQFSERIRGQTRRKILKNSQPINLDALKRSMAVDEPTHIGCIPKARMVSG